MFEGVQCCSATAPEESSSWLAYKGPDAERIRESQRVLTAAREAGVFTVGMFVAKKPD